jgi:hypothetical protein
MKQENNKFQMRWHPGRGRSISHPQGHWSGRMADGTAIEVHPNVYDQQATAYLARIGIERTTWSQIMRKAEAEWQQY